MATKIKLMRLGKMREPHYRIVVADSRTKRDGRAIETIGEYHPKNDPSLIEVDCERAPTGSASARSRPRRSRRSSRSPATGRSSRACRRPAPMQVADAQGRQAGACSTPRWPTTSGEPATEATTPKKQAAKKAGRDAEAEAAPTAAEAAAAEAAGGRRPPQPRRRAERGRRRRRRADVLEEALEHLVRGIVDHPDDVRVDLVDNRRGQRLEVRVHPDDLGQVIGRSGRTAKALRQVVDRRRRQGRPRRRRRRRPTLTADRCAWPPTSSSRSAGSAGRAACAARSFVEPLDRRPRRAVRGRVRCCVTDPAERRPADRRVASALHSGRLRRAASTGVDDRDARRGAARHAAADRRRSTRPPTRGPGRVLRHRAGRAARAVRPTAAELGPVARRRSTRRRSDFLVARRATGARGWSRSSRAIVPDGRRRRRPRRRSTRRDGLFEPVSDRTLRLDVVTIFPDYLAPLRLSLLGKASERGPVDVARARPARLDRRRAPHRRRHARTAAARAWSCGPSRGGEALDEIAPPDADAQPRLVVPTPAGRPFTQADGRASWPPSRGWSSPAAATRASTRGSLDVRRPTGCASTRSASATTCSPAARSAVLVIVEAVARLLPGVLGNAESAVDDSFADGPDGLLEAPGYTKPPTWRGLRRPAGAAVRRPRRRSPAGGATQSLRADRAAPARPARELDPARWLDAPAAAALGIVEADSAAPAAVAD